MHFGAIKMVRDGLSRLLSILIILGAGSIGPPRVQGQWIPPLELRKVPIFEDCKMTRHRVGLSIQPNLVYPRGAIFMCPERENEIDKQHPRASRFFLVHEYGHLALHTREEAVADEWAAKQLAAIPSEKSTLKAALLHFLEQGRVFDPLYGTGLDRGLRVAEAAQLPRNEWPAELVAYADSESDRRGNRTTLTLEMAEGYANAAQMTIYLDRQLLGFLSNVEEVKVLKFPSLAPGRHLLEAEEVWIFHIDPGGEKAEVARGLRAQTEFELTGKRLAVNFRFDGETVTIHVIDGR
jgi:hypothetical protein